MNEITKEKYLRIKELIALVEFELLHDGLISESAMELGRSRIHYYYDPINWEERVVDGKHYCVALAPSIQYPV